MTETLPVLFDDGDIIAVNKPSGLLVHRSMIDRHETRFALQILRDQIGQRVYPLHRLDKPTSGVLLFARSADAARAASTLFAERQVHKTYLAICRGHAPAAGAIDHPLKEELDKLSDRKARQDKPAQAALTDYRCLATATLPVAIDRYPESRFSLIECRPHTGRKHQIRRHLKHINHPIIGDAKHGKGNYNRYFKQQLNAGRLLLSATETRFPHPYKDSEITVTAPLDSIFRRLLVHFEWCDAIPSAWLAPTDPTGKLDATG